MRMIIIHVEPHRSRAMSANTIAFPHADTRAAERGPRAVPPAETLDSEALLKGRREILIQHGDRVYRLRHTSNDKLILTK
ncbi:hemin uptake protein HemP [Pseudoxanthomonas winnipegensis]|uniref:Hemin uptake protein HemP n=2 Tax=Lysobacteraceae TaxID=32033 RepID=A0A4Q8L7V3_9GAMM|nr:MAG: hemin uptake protein HemP [Pseudoxanthomonas spadix]TAA24305.1 hemin uptake protein HemP [Pseudoxanthomonas winnipegensis]TMN17724.1 hemin uptake protein HemP [Pseudoxanthomonas sp. X-1]